MWTRYKGLIIGAGVGLVLVILLAVGWLVIVTAKAHAPASGAKAEKLAVQRVGKLMILPGNETPALITVVNKDSIKNISFLGNAMNGDQMLVYYNAKIAILYRPSVNKIVNVGPVSLPPPPKK